MKDVNQLITEHLDIWTSSIEKKSSAGRGDGRSVSLHGIKKLRELILELAVRGKLVAQDELEGRGQDVLDAIAKHRKALLASGAIKKPKRRNQASNVPFFVPENWSWAELDDLTPWQLTDGDWIEKKDQDPQGGVRLIQLADVGVAEFLDKSERFVNEATFHRLKCTQLDEGDILIARLPNPIGRACTFPDIGQTAITAVDVAILRPTEEVSRQYLVWAINSNMARLQVEAFGKGATRFRISTGNLKSINIPVPPLAEQHRIVAKVDELMALCDALERQAEDSLKAHQTLVETCLATLTNSGSPEELTQNWTRIEAHFDTLFTTEESLSALWQAIVDLAVSGLLTEQRANDSSVGDFFKAVRLAQSSGLPKKRSKPKKSLGNLLSTDLPSLPSGWEWAQLSEIGATSTGGTPKSSDKESFSGDVPFLGPGQLSKDGHILDPDKFLTERGVTNSTEGLPGDILMVCIGGSIGKSAIVLERCAFNQQINSVRPAAGAANFFHLVLQSSYFQKVVLDRATGSATPIINRSKWESISVPIPPVEEQERIVARVDELFELLRRTSIEIIASQALQVQLADTLTSKIH